MMAFYITRLEKVIGAFSGKEMEVPKLILAAVAWLHKPGSPSAADAHAARHAATRSRDATRRLLASGVHDPYFDLSPLDLRRRH